MFGRERRSCAWRYSFPPRLDFTEPSAWAADGPSLYAAKRDRVNLGIEGKRAIVCAASQGLGRGCAEALAREGVHVTIAARTRDTLETAAHEIEEETGVPVSAVVADVTTAGGRAAVLEACPEPDILINNGGGEPPGDFRDWAPDDWLRAVNASMITPIEMIKAAIDGMTARRFGRIVNITSSAVKAPLKNLGLSNAGRSGLTGFVAGLAREFAPHGVTINNILPGAFDTGRLRVVLGYAAKQAGRTFEEQLAIRTEAIPAHRIGSAAELGALCAYLCSVHAGYITGQNVLIDGGAYPGTF
jgi:3-oxoacyl-[acyl-carrier protein] reductase